MPVLVPLHSPPSARAVNSALERETHLPQHCVMYYSDTKCEKVVSDEGEALSTTIHLLHIDQLLCTTINYKPIYNLQGDTTDI